MALKSRLVGLLLSALVRAVRRRRSDRHMEVAMKKLAAALVVLAVVLVPNMALAAPWTSSVTFTNQVASTPFRAGGYPVPPGMV